MVSRDGGMYLAAVENGKLLWIPVETGVESDVAMEIKGDGLSEGLVYMVTPDAAIAEGTSIAPSMTGAPTQAAQKTESETEGKPESETEGKAESEAESKPESEIESRAGSKTEGGSENESA